MSHTATTGEMDSCCFGDNVVRLEIVCNSLQSFANGGHEGTRSADEAETLANFFESELPGLMHQIKDSLTTAIQVRGRQIHEVAAALEIMQEDHERLVQMVGVVIEELKKAAQSPDQYDNTALRRAISAYLAALRSNMSWSRKIMLETRI